MATEADYERLGAWAVMFNPDANIDRHNRQRTVPLEVLSLGLPRTGTLSMQEALTTLGYPTYHYCRMFENVKDTDIWMEAYQAKQNDRANTDWRKLFDQVLGDYSAVTDAPGVVLWKELLEAYPEAKIVLVERDVNQWMSSFEVLVEGVLNPAATYVLRWSDPTWFGRVINCGRGWIRLLVGTTDVKEVKKHSKGVYEAHYTNVRAAVPKDKILDYKLGSGWEPLCKFLGKDIPNVPFPHRNETDTLKNSFGEIIGRSLKRSLFNGAVVTGVLAISAGLIRQLV